MVKCKRERCTLGEGYLMTLEFRSVFGENEVNSVLVILSITYFIAVYKDMGHS